MWFPPLRVVDACRLNASMMYTSSFSNPISMLSSLTLFNYLLLRFPLFLLPCFFSPISLHLILQLSFLRITCPYHFNLRSWIFCETFSSFLVHPIASSYNMSNTFQAHPGLSYTSNFSSWNPIIYALPIRQNTPYTVPSASHSYSLSTACLQLWHELSTGWACETKLLNSYALIDPTNNDIIYSSPRLSQTSTGIPIISKALTFLVRPISVQPLIVPCLLQYITKACNQVLFV